MARINIEDSLYKDSRFMGLYINLKSVETALGALIRVWTVAQEFYLKDDGKIPIEVWKRQGLNDEIINVGLAINENGRIRVCGADNQFQWLAQRVEAGRKGGLSTKRVNESLSSEERTVREKARKKIANAVQRGRLQKPDYCEACHKKDTVIEAHHADYSKPFEVNWVCKKCHLEIHDALITNTNEQGKRLLTSVKRVEAVAKREEAEAKPLISSSISTLTLTQELNTIAADQLPLDQPRSISPIGISTIGKSEQPKSQAVKKLYCASFKRKYGTDPVWGVKENVNANSLITSVGYDVALKLAEYYPNYIDPWHVKQRHPFLLLTSKAHQVLTDMQNIKHVVDARIHEKHFDERVEDFEHESKMEVLKQQAELGRMAFEWAKRENPGLLDYKFEYENFLESKNIQHDLPYRELKTILIQKNRQKVIA